LQQTKRKNESEQIGLTSDARKKKKKKKKELTSAADNEISTCNFTIKRVILKRENQNDATTTKKRVKL
jgi:hypothetical protein